MYAMFRSCGVVKEGTIFASTIYNKLCIPQICGDTPNSSFTSSLPSIRRRLRSAATVDCSCHFRRHHFRRRRLQSAAAAAISATAAVNCLCRCLCLRSAAAFDPPPSSIRRCHFRRRRLRPLRLRSATTFDPPLPLLRDGGERISFGIQSDPHHYGSRCPFGQALG